MLGLGEVFWGGDSMRKGGDRTVWGEETSWKGLNQIQNSMLGFLALNKVSQVCTCKIAVTDLKDHCRAWSFFPGKGYENSLSPKRPLEAAAVLQDAIVAAFVLLDLMAVPPLVMAPKASRRV